MATNILTAPRFAYIPAHAARKAQHRAARRVVNQVHRALPGGLKLGQAKVLRLALRKLAEPPTAHELALLAEAETGYAAWQAKR